MVQSRAVEAASTKSQVENSSIFGGLLTLVIACALVYAGWRIVPPSDVEDTANAPDPEAACASAAATWSDREDHERPVTGLAEMVARNGLWIASKKKQGEQADFRSADLRCVNLRGSHLEGANLRGADLTGADLTGADLSGADLQGADLSYAILEQAKLAGADLSSAYLKGASLSHADLTSAILHDANFTQANLSYANLHSADLDGDTDLESADVESVTFEPKNLPATENTYLARNLSRLTYGEPREMVVLRNAFHTDGYTDQERRVTYAIQRQQTRTEWEQCRKGSSGRSCAVAVAKWLVYDKTFQYGVNPDRPLYLAIGLWLWCSVIYVSILESVREPVILRFQRNDGATDYPGTPVVPAELSATNAWPVVCREAKIWWTALFFSLESALNIGFGEFQPGRWLRILATTDYELKAVGWTRTLSGAQSLFSLLMFALAIWGLFGQPFSG